MASGDDTERRYPSDRLVVDVIHAAMGATEAEVIECLGYLRDGRALKPGAKYGPRHFAWFKTAVGDYFSQKRDREQVFAGAPNWNLQNGPGLTQEQMNEKTDAIELPSRSK
jgi:hypothetical protein